MLEKSSKMSVRQAMIELAGASLASLAVWIAPEIRGGENAG